MPLTIDPPLLNSSNPWATTLDDLKNLYDCPYTGAVSTRTSVLNGFKHNPDVHRYAFFDPLSHHSISNDKLQKGSDGGGEKRNGFEGSLNTLGYSPSPLQEYLEDIKTISAERLPPDPQTKRKSVIISITGTAEEVVRCYHLITQCSREVTMPLAMEINLSCPNIPDKPPPAYSGSALISYLEALRHAVAAVANRRSAMWKAEEVTIGIKTPPYTYMGQFKELVDTLEKVQPCPIGFVTVTNTLGSSLLLDPHSFQPMLTPISSDSSTSTATTASSNTTPTSSTNLLSGIGGMAGAPLHPLALGNVRILREMLQEKEGLRHLQLIGVGGVSDGEGFNRMRSVGADAVGVGTALGREGVGIFEKILQKMKV